MNKSLLMWLLAIVVVLALVSCKKSEEETTTLPYMSGYVEYSIPSYVMVNETYTMTASGIVKPVDPIYKWHIPSLFGDTLTTNTISITFPDSLASYTITAIASKSGYYNSSNARLITTVDTTRGASLTGLIYGNSSFTDVRDGQKYITTKVGNLEWFAQNLAWSGAGVAYKWSSATHSLFGRYYYWNEATGGVSASGLGAGPQGVCPKGWSIPTNEDWEDLGKALNGNKAVSFMDNWAGLGEKVTVDAYFNGERMWPYSPDNANKNMFGWNALPTGNTQFGNTLFKGMNEYAFWWSAAEKNDKQAYFRYIYYDQSSFPMNFTAKDDFGASVRCVRLIK
ncbi:MAG: FISUMP domain-containing protein [Bacteroidales bacterium]|nr:FISUMP domain-containing protein [Bacteroidales bacterium]